MKGLDPGSVCTLKTGQNTLGRNARRCDVVLQHYAVSREHAVIQVTPEGTFIEDLGSRNGVLVNGKPLTPGAKGRRRLVPRDRIEVASFAFVFHEDPSTDALSVVDDTRTSTSILSSVDISSDSSHQLLKSALSETSAALQGDIDTRRTSDVAELLLVMPESAWARLDAVLSLIEKTGGTIDASEAPSVILDSLFHTFLQTESGCVLLRDDSPTGFSAVASKATQGSRATPRISQAVLQYVVRNKRGVLSGEAGSDEAFSLSESAANLRVRSVMCVPLLDLTGDVLGVISLETSKTKSPFTKADLAVLAGVARHLAIVIDNAQLHAATLRAQRDEYAARFRTLVEGSIQGVLIHRDFEPLFVNEAWAALHGYAADEVLDMISVLPLVAQEDREPVIARNRARKHGLASPHRSEFRGLRKDGSSIWLEEYATVVDWDDGPAVQSTLIDLTERKQAELLQRRIRDELEIRVGERTKELADANRQLQSEITDRLRAETDLQESFSLYNSLVDHIPLCVIRKSPDGRFIFVNKAICKLFNCTPQALLGKTDYDFFTKEQADKYRAADEQVMQARQQMELFETVPLPSGEVLQIHTLKTPICDGEGRVLGTQLIFWDITAHKRLEDERNRYASELERSNRDLEHFAYIVSHDLRSPLRTITSYSQMLQKRCHNQLDEEGRDYLGNAIEGTKRMRRLLDDLLEYSRVSTESRELSEVDLEKVLQAALGNLAALIRENGAVVSHDAMPNVIGAPTQLMQLLQNLVDNALKYRQQSAPRIHVGAEDLGNEWQFSVKDNGLGIDPKQFDRIFQIFHRLHAETDRPGAGIGLSVCKRIVERHGGRIWVDSQLGAGSTFYFTLPKKA
jgi:PAS domain S-box-containing protein